MRNRWELCIHGVLKRDCPQCKEPTMERLKSAVDIDSAVMMVCATWAEMRSKDPSTKVGACILDPDTGGLFLGYNGFPAGVADSKEVWERRGDLTQVEPKLQSHTEMYELTKYDLVVHAEVNAVRKALRAGVLLANATLVVTHLPCPRCMKDVVLSNGIRQVVYGTERYSSCGPRELWLVRQMAMEARVSLRQLSPTGYFEARNAKLDQTCCERDHDHDGNCDRHPNRGRK